MYVGFLRILSAMDTKTEEKFLASLIPAAFLDLFFDSCHLTHWCFVDLHKGECSGCIFVLLLIIKVGRKLRLYQG